MLRTWLHEIGFRIEMSVKFGLTMERIKILSWYRIEMERKNLAKLEIKITFKMTKSIYVIAYSRM